MTMGSEEPCCALAASKRSTAEISSATRRYAAPSSVKVGSPSLLIEMRCNRESNTISSRKRGMSLHEYRLLPRCRRRRTSSCELVRVTCSVFSRRSFLEDGQLG